MVRIFVGCSILVPVAFLIRLGIAALLIGFGARQWYQGRDEHYEER